VCVCVHVCARVCGMCMQVRALYALFFWLLVHLVCSEVHGWVHTVTHPWVMLS